MFTSTVNVACFVSGTFDLFDIMCKQHHMKVKLTVLVKEALL